MTQALAVGPLLILGAVVLFRRLEAWALESREPEPLR